MTHDDRELNAVLSAALIVAVCGDAAPMHCVQLIKSHGYRQDPDGKWRHRPKVTP